MARETWGPLSTAEQNQTEFTDPNVIDGDVSGNAATATALQNPRTINGVSFDGTANITVPVGNTIFIGAGEMIPRTTTGAGIGSYETATNDVNYDTLEFDAAIVTSGNLGEAADFIRILPSTWNSGTVTAKFYWTAASGSGTVTFALQARSFGDNVALDTAFGTAQSSTDTLQTAGNMHVSPATSAITIGGTPANGVPVIFQVYRDVSDSLGVDALLIGIEITFTQS